METPSINPHIVEDLIRLRDELIQRMHESDNVLNLALAEVLAEVALKINSCLYKGYPRRAVNSNVEMN